VPSGELSSTTSTVAPGSASRMAGTIVGRLSASLKVGSTTQVSSNGSDGGAVVSLITPEV
jgi:hypothetical protein